VARLLRLGHVEAITIIIAAVMILNNLLGSPGSACRALLVTPILIVWCIYMVAKGSSPTAGIWAARRRVAAVLVAIVA